MQDAWTNVNLFFICLIFQSATDSHTLPFAVSHCWSSCSSVPTTPSPYPVARSSSQTTNMSNISSASSVKTVIAAINKVVSNKLELEGEEFDIAEDLERSMDMFNGLIKTKDDEIEVLTTKVLELKKELEFQDEKDKGKDGVRFPTRCAS